MSVQPATHGTLLRMVVGFRDCSIVAAGGERWVRHDPSGRKKNCPSSLDDCDEVEMFDWLSDTVDWLRLAHEAEQATAPDGPPQQIAA